MSYMHFGYPPYSSSSQLVVGGSGQTRGSPGTCYERGSVNGESQPPTSMCSFAATYDSRLLSTYPRLTSGLTATSGLYSTPEQPEYSSLSGVESPAFYSTLNTAYGMKGSGVSWRGISHPTSCYYDPTLAAYGYAGLDFNGARRKNVTRDSTSTLKAWLNEHRKNPYPTKGEKIMLAIITKMTLTQVSTWFANARRRLKKENKMTWEPRNKSEHEDEEGVKKEERISEEDRESDYEEGSKKAECLVPSEFQVIPKAERESEVYQHKNVPEDSKPRGFQCNMNSEVKPFSVPNESSPGIVESCAQHSSNSLPCNVHRPGFTPSESSQGSSPDLSPIDSYISSPSLSGDTRDSLTRTELQSTPSKPKIWSLADTATNKTDTSPLPPNPYPDSVPENFRNGHCNPPVVSPNQCRWSTGMHGLPPPTEAMPPRANFINNGQYQLTARDCHGTYNCVHGFAPVALQTDTPPQTPPNLKGPFMGPSISGSYLGSQPSPQIYMSPGSTGHSNISIPAPAVDSVSCNVSHLNSQPPSCSSHQRPECFSEEYSTYVHYTASPVQ